MSLAFWASSQSWPGERALIERLMTNHRENETKEESRMSGEHRQFINVTIARQSCSFAKPRQWAFRADSFPITPTFSHNWACNWYIKRLIDDRLTACIPTRTASDGIERAHIVSSSFNHHIAEAWAFRRSMKRKNDRKFHGKKELRQQLWLQCELSPTLTVKLEWIRWTIRICRDNPLKVRRSRNLSIVDRRDMCFVMFNWHICWNASRLFFKAKTIKRSPNLASNDSVRRTASDSD